MERMLLKLAAQLNAIDEASLMDLWHKMAENVENFEPTKRWEEQAIALGMIQALHMKNQLFNYNLAELNRNDKDSTEDINFLSTFNNNVGAFIGRRRITEEEIEKEKSKEEPLVKCKVLQFRPRD